MLVRRRRRKKQQLDGVWRLKSLDWKEAPYQRTRFRNRDNFRKIRFIVTTIDSGSRQWPELRGCQVSPKDEGEKRPFNYDREPRTSVSYTHLTLPTTPYV